MRVFLDLGKSSLCFSKDYIFSSYFIGVSELMFGCLMNLMSLVGHLVIGHIMHICECLVHCSQAHPWTIKAFTHQPMFGDGSVYPSTKSISGNQHYLLHVHMVGLEQLLMRLMLIQKMTSLTSERLFFELTLRFQSLFLYFTPHYTFLA
jgi:hypothetical protein